MTSDADYALPPPSAVRDVYVIVRRGDDILVLLRSGTGYKDGDWGPPAGKVEPGESYAEAAVRELDEETGIRVTTGDLRFLHVIERVPSAGDPWVGMFFEVAVPDVSPVNREPHKHSEIDFVAASALPERTMDYVRHVIEAVARGELYSEWRF
jgi:8-oxo-dGTP pyrophosphatase MutT (NUDIX family)